MVRPGPLRDTFSASENAEPAPPADTLDEYRELEMLAHAWERGSLNPWLAEGAPGRVEDAEQNESVQR
ncbi:MAG TPA: hypothetical protein VHV80_05420 [Steroidobacteraceae bacterium]|nr:hypothetical protein [Steroidobacteraceae bacterium]